MSLLLNRQNQAAELYERGQKQWAAGKLSAAFRLFLAAAKTGFAPAFGTVAQFYDNGWAIKTNLETALYWYKRAHRSANSRYRDSTAANNIGCILRDKGEQKKAISWFQRAAKLGDGDANLNIAKIYLRSEGSRQTAIRYLQKTCRAPYVTDGSIEEAKKLLKKIRSKSLRTR
jgi:TPR repeat protein